MTRRPDGPRRRTDRHTDRQAERHAVRHMGRHAVRRAEGRTDGGWSLIEIMVAMSVTAVALVLLVPVLTTVTTVTSATNSTANGTAQARLALQQLSSDIGSTTSANVCFPATVLAAPPATTCSSVATSGYPLAVLSRVYGTCTWFQWNVNGAGQLTQQSAPRNATTWSASVPMTSSIANTVTPSLFTYDTTNSLMSIQLLIRGATGTAATASASAAKPGTQTINLQTSVSLYTTALSPAAGSC